MFSKLPEVPLLLRDDLVEAELLVLTVSELLALRQDLVSLSSSVMLARFEIVEILMDAKIELAVRAGSLSLSESVLFSTILSSGLLSVWSSPRIVPPGVLGVGIFLLLIGLIGLERYTGGRTVGFFFLARGESL